MSLTELFVRRPIGVLLLGLGLFLTGAVAFNLLPVAPLPRVDIPTIMISAKLPGAAPETMAATVTAPLERRLGEIAGVSEMTSSSSQGSASIIIQFDLSRSVDSAAKDVQAALNASGGDLPADMPNPPTYRKANPADMPIMVLGVTSENLPLSKLYDVSDTILAQSISQLEGVSQVSVGGAVKPAVRIQANPSALAAMGVGLEDLRTAISGANANKPKGSLDGLDQGYAIGANDQLTSAADYAPLIVKTTNGAIVRLSDVAKVLPGQENDRQAGWADRKKAVLVIIQKQADANIIETVDRINAVLPQLESWLPAGAEVTVVNDRTTTIRASVHDVERTLLITTGLVILVVLFSLGRLTPTVAASVTVPLSLAGTFAAMWLLGYSLNNISLMALTISVGFVVDDAIVMIENIARHVENGDSPLSAAVKGAKEITFTVISISISLVAVFIPLLFMGGVVGRMFREFAVTLTASIMISMLVSITVTPVVYGHLMHLRANKPRKMHLHWGESLMSRAQRTYLNGLSWVMRHQIVMLCVMAGTIAFTIYLYGVVPKGLFPQQDTGLVMGMTEARIDVSFRDLAAKQQKVVEVLLNDPAVERAASFVGSGGPGPSGSNTGRMFITLKPIAERKLSADKVIARLRPKLAAIPGVNVFLMPAQDLFIGGRSPRSQYQFVLSSESLDDLKTWTPKLIDRLRAEPGLVDVTSDQDDATSQETVVVDRDAAARLGLDMTSIDNALQDAFSQRQISTIYTQRNQYHVVLEVSTDLQEEATALQRIYVASSSGAQVPLSAVAHFQIDPMAPSVNHQGQFPASALSFNLLPGTPLSVATEAVQKAALEIGMPASVHTEFAGNAKAFADTTRNQPMLIMAALLAIYIVLGVLYESWLHPVTIISTLPSAGIGALLALLISGTELSIISVIGVILLMGIVKKNGIMLVDFAIEAERKRGISPERAIMEACKHRFRPITMTTLAAVLGAVPLALGTGTGSEMRQPLGISIVGGLLVSQLLTLYTTPVVYLALGRLARWRKARAETRLSTGMHNVQDA
ncbi:MAG TPA: efflux RND transporter permease subunit [Candidatus Sulfotelmatobacter sp.]|jgi:hydrophobe/amphiphile efflux-1 (HAE1) family protein|nr:efflux RND transporter permease subunit [Candidatus Sulfotelmatobacter sp.]